VSTVPPPEPTRHPSTGEDQDMSTGPAPATPPAQPDHPVPTVPPVPPAQPVPPTPPPVQLPPPVATGPAVGTIVWGVVVLVLGLVLGAREVADVRVDVSLALPVGMVVTGVLLLVGAVVTNLRRDRRGHV
jgi:hypothetical protein